MVGQVQGRAASVEFSGARRSRDRYVVNYYPKQDPLQSGFPESFWDSTLHTSSTRYIVGRLIEILAFHFELQLFRLCVALESLESKAVDVRGS